MDSDEEDFVFVGTPIEREDDDTSRKKKAVAEASGHLRTLVPWKQEVRDEEGRRRFHGAFTGGFSAGYFNTVGSKEGWTPQTFTSSRKNRAEIKQQDISNFLDEDEKAEMEGNLLGTSSQFDTFGFTAAELARKQAEKEQKQRPLAIPGPVPDELVVPAAESIGVKLLLKMGWRHGRAIKDKRANSLYDVRREARKAVLALSSDGSRVDVTENEICGSELDSDQPVNDGFQTSQSTPVYVSQPKQDLHGLGYDPYKNAPEFREKKRLRLSEAKDVGSRRPFNTKDDLLSKLGRKSAPGFGIGALEDLDVEDEDVYAAGYYFEEIEVEEDDEPSRLMISNEQTVDNNRKLGGKKLAGLPGFKIASTADYRLQRFDPPVVPESFVPLHKFATPLDLNQNIADVPPPEVPPPEDNNLKVLIEGVATLVARCGKLFEDLSTEKNQSNPLFSFLTGGRGHEYYARRLWEERQKHSDHKKLLLDGNLYSSVQKLTAESRGKLLGERPLERSTKDPDPSVASADDTQKQFNLSDAFTQPESFVELLETAKPFKDDPAKQGRFEQFLKDKYQGGLRSTYSGGASNMSEGARARERIDFEAAAEAIQKARLGNQVKTPAQLVSELMTTTGLQFTSSGVEQVSQAEDMMSTKMYPKREEYQWRPAPLLCKRFEIIDPYMGKPPPPPRARSKMDSFIFAPESVRGTKLEEIVAASGQSAVPIVQEVSKEQTNGGNEAVVEVENVERPVDLYKAIFSDESDDEGENSNQNQVEDQHKNIDAANTTLSRLVAGDFLESLGKELGLEVPPEPPLLHNKSQKTAVQKNVDDANATSTYPKGIVDVQNLATGRESSGNKQVMEIEPSDQVTAPDSATKGDDMVHEKATDGGKMLHDTTHWREPDNVEGKSAGGYRKGEISHRHDHRSSSSPSGHGRSRKHARRHRKESCSSDSDSSDGEERDYSRSRSRSKHSREKRRRRKHSKHKRGRDERSSCHSGGRDHSESRRERRK